MDEKLTNEIEQTYGDVLDESGNFNDENLEFDDTDTEISEEPAQKNAPQNDTAADNLTIPYSRFKEISDQKTESEKLLAAYRERFGDLNSVPPQSQNQAQYQPQFQPPSIDENFSKQIDDAITQNAMKISGLSKEDVDGLDYLDDDDPKVSRWNHAKKISESAIYNDIVNRQFLQQQEMQRAEMLRNQTFANYQNYVAQQQAAENFSAVQQFAENDFFNAQPDIDKQIIMESYARINNNVASPADIMVVRDYFSRAKFAYENGQNNTRPQPKPKTKPAPNNFPRTNKINGMTGGGGVSQAALADMLRNKKWNQIPPNYQKMLLGL